MTLTSFFGSDRVDIEGLSKHLDGLSNDARVVAVRTLGKKQQAALFEAANGFRSISLEHFVPSDKAALVEVIHEGKNTLPAFTTFQKRFCRPDDPELKDQLWGYNHQAMGFFTGPGYFVARADGDDRVVIDYFDVPPSKPDSWPTIRPNSRLFSRFVYYQMRDYMRGVSKHVTIGRARKDKDMDAWFLLCRQDV